jgi:glycosyltransferase involved in cell wall biosynthesis
MNLTIVTAAWRAENLSRVIESIENQTVKGFEHIIVNDNNPEVRNIFKNLCDGEHRHWIDIGVRTHFYGAIARNIGVMSSFSYIHHSKRDIENEWIVFCDDDNLWKPNHIQTIIEALAHNPHATMVATDSIWVGAHNKDWNEIRLCKIARGKCDLGQFAYKTLLFKKYGYFDAHPHSKQLYDWRLIRKMAEGEGDKLIFTNQPTFIMSYRKK